MSSTPSTSELLALGAPIALRDGSRVRVRQIRSSDKEVLRRGFERPSEESRYRRFIAPMPELREATVRYLTEVDHNDHEAIVALDAESGAGDDLTGLAAAAAGAPLLADETIDRHVPDAVRDTGRQRERAAYERHHRAPAPSQPRIGEP